MTPVAVIRQVVCVVALLSSLGLHCTSGAPQSFQPQGNVGKCVGDPVSFTCTVVDDNISSGGESTVWRASGGIDCTGNIAHNLGLSDTCSGEDPDAFFINGTVQNTNCVVFELSANMATVNMNNTLIECYNSLPPLVPANLVGSSRLFVEDSLPPPMIIDIIDLSTECVVIQLEVQRSACLDTFTVGTVGSAMTNTSVDNNITICGIDLCNDMLSFTVRSNAEDFNSMETRTSMERFPSPGSVKLESTTYTPINIMVEVSWQNEESFIDGLLDIIVSITTDIPADVSCTPPNLSENRFQCTLSYSNFLSRNITFTVMFHLASCVPPTSSTAVPFPIIISGSTVDMNDTSAAVTLTYVSGINVDSGFMLVGNISQGGSVVANINQGFRLSDARYEIANNLNRTTSYTYDIRIESGTDSSIVIGRASGSFMTSGSGAIIGSGVGVALMLVIAMVVYL